MEIPELDEDDLKGKRMELDNMYMQQYQEDRRITKKPDQKAILKREFEKDPVWSYKKKMEIACFIGMNVNQVSKWNWDQRKKMGLSTDRKKREPAKKKQ